MAVNYNSRKPSSSGGFLDIVERYWLVLLGLIIGYPILMRYFQDAGTKDTINKLEEKEKVLVNAVQNPVTELAELNKITTSTYIHNIARNVAIAFGTDEVTKETPWWEAIFKPRSYSENDVDAYNQLRLLTNSGQVRLTIECYYILTRRNLTADVKKYLDSELLNKLPLFK